MPTIQKVSEQVYKDRKRSGVCSAKQICSKFAIIAVATLIAASMGFGGLAVQDVYADNTSASSAGTQGFVDVPATHWAYEGIMEMKNRGVITGFPDGSFRPEATVTKAQFDKMLICLFDLEVIQGSGNKFTDLNEASWAADVINTAKIKGFIPEIYDEKYNPNSNMTRAEGSYGVQKLMEYHNGIADNNSNVTYDFTDGSFIPQYAKDSIFKMVNSGLIKGFPDNSFRPGENLTRAQAAKLFYSVYKFVRGDKTVQTPPVVEQPAADVQYSAWYQDEARISYKLEPCDGITKRLLKVEEHAGIFALPLTGKEEWSIWMPERGIDFANYTIDEAIAKGIVKEDIKDKGSGNYIYRYKENVRCDTVKVYFYEYRDVIRKTESSD